MLTKPQINYDVTGGGGSRHLAVINRTKSQFFLYLPSAVESGWFFALDGLGVERESGRAAVHPRRDAVHADVELLTVVGEGIARMDDQIAVIRVLLLQWTLEPITQSCRYRSLDRGGYKGLEGLDN